MDVEAVQDDAARPRLCLSRHPAVGISQCVVADTGQRCVLLRAAGLRSLHRLRPLTDTGRTQRRRLRPSDGQSTKRQLFLFPSHLPFNVQQFRLCLDNKLSLLWVCWLGDSKGVMPLKKLPAIPKDLRETLRKVVWLNDKHM